MSCRSLLLALSLLATTAWGLPTDREQPIHVTADSAVQEGEQVTYRGDVLIVQGSLRIEAAQVVVHNRDGQVQRMVATGERAHLQQLPEPDAALVKARARRITYLRAEDLVILEREAEVEQKGSVVTGERIDYLPATRAVHARGGGRGKNGEGRVQMVLQPKHTDDDTNDDEKPGATPARDTPGDEESDATTERP